MGDQWQVSLLLTLLITVLSAFFVAAEYSLVGTRRSRIESMARRGSGAAKSLLQVLDNLPWYLAGIQVAITMCGIGMGAIAEPLITEWFSALLGPALGKAAGLLSVLMVTILFVVTSELAPKYVTLKYTDRVALTLVKPLRFVVPIFSPLVWVVQILAKLLLKPFRIEVTGSDEQIIGKEELALLVRGHITEGPYDEIQAQVVTRALRFDELDTADVMVHRLDMKWINYDTPREELISKLLKTNHSRVPVCRGDLDDIVGVLYVRELLAQMDNPEFSLDSILRQVPVVPENLKLSKLVNLMREERTHMVIVVDEYGGTSGLVTLEDLVEEVFGELDDQHEADRPAIERISDHRLSARADVRMDELLDYLDREADNGIVSTETLAQIVVDQLERVPKLGDFVEMPFGRLRVENMARRRITRIGIQLSETPSDSKFS